MANEAVSRVKIDKNLVGDFSAPSSSKVKVNNMSLIGSTFRTIDLFAGIGGIRLGFEHWGCRNIFSSDIPDWKHRIQSVVTLTELKAWYEKALRGKNGKIIGDEIIGVLKDQIMLEFPASEDSNISEFFQSRDYL